MDRNQCGGWRYLRRYNEKSDSRIVYNVERIRLADVNSPEMDTAQGPSARDFTFSVLMNKRVYLDIDDQSGNGRDEYGRLISVAHLAGFYGQPLATPCFNRMLVDSGHAALKNFTIMNSTQMIGGPSRALGQSISRRKVCK